MRCQIILVVEYFIHYLSFKTVHRRFSELTRSPPTFVSGLLDSLMCGAEAEDVGDGPSGGVGVVFAEGGFGAAVHFHFEGADVEVELGFGAAFEMMGGDDADTGGEEFVVEIVHG